MAAGDVGPGPIFSTNNRFDPNGLNGDVALNPLPPVPWKPTLLSGPQTPNLP